MSDNIHSRVYTCYVVFAVCTISLTFLYKINNMSAKVVESTEPQNNVKVIRLKKQTQTPMLSLFGFVKKSNPIVRFADKESSVEEIFIKPKQIVSKGQPLFKFRYDITAEQGQLTKERDIIYPNEQMYIRGFLPTLSIK